MFSIIGTIIVGFIVGVIAKMVHSGSNEPSGFVLTTVLGIIGAFVGTFLGQALGWYVPGDTAGWIVSVVGAVIVLAIWHDSSPYRYPGVGRASRLMDAFVSALILGAAVIAGVVFGDLLEKPVRIAAISWRRSIQRKWKDFSRRNGR